MISIISIILDIIIYKYIKISSYLLPLFTIISIIFLKEKNYYLKLFLLGFIYDILFTDIFPLHIIIFLILGLITKKFKYSLKNNLILCTILIVIYQLIISLINKNTNIYEFIYISKHFLIINYIYIFIITKIKNIIKN